MMRLPARVLVTGGAGFVGSHACLALAEDGVTPIVYDNLSRGHRQAVQWGPLVIGDLLDRNALDDAFDTHQPEAVLHFAALAYVGESVTHPERYWRTNVGGTATLLGAMRRARVHKLVFSSTCAIYGEPPRQPMDEDLPLAPVNPYGATKVAAEQAIRDAGAGWGLRSICLRYFNAAGADPEGRLVERHDPETHLLPLAIDAALGKRPPLTVFGDDWPTPDGTCVRDYIHVLDLAAAHVGALAHLEAGADSDAFNLGTGHGHSVREVLQAVEAALGRPVPHSVGPRRPGDPPTLTALSTRAHTTLGWKPRRTDLVQIVRDAARNR